MTTAKVHTCKNMRGQKSLVTVLTLDVNNILKNIVFKYLDIHVASPNYCNNTVKMNYYDNFPKESMES
jgi:hypothetical protein